MSLLPGTVVRVATSFVNDYEDGAIGVIDQGTPTNGDDLYVRMTDVSHVKNPVALSVGTRLSYKQGNVEVVSEPVTVKPAPRKFTTRNGEKWVGRGHRNTRKTGRVTAVRVAKGDPSGRGGQFHGATNFGEVNV